MKLLIHTILLCCVTTVFTCQDCTHNREYKDDNIISCDKIAPNSNIELQININVGYGMYTPKVTTNSLSLTENNTHKNENNTSLVLHNSTLSNMSPSIITEKNAPSTTPSPTTQSPTTPSPTTPSPTTQSPTTPSPTTQSPTTQSPTTQSPTTPSPKKDINEIVEEEIITSMKTPSSSLRGTSNTKKNMSKTEEKEVNVGVIVTISVLSTVLVLMIICGIIYKVKFKNTKVNNINNIETDTREFRRRIEEANKEKNIPLNSKSKPPRLPESKKPKKLPTPPLIKKRILVEPPPNKKIPAKNPKKIVKNISETKTPQSEGLLMLDE